VKRPARIAAGLAIFLFFVGAAERAADFEEARAEPPKQASSAGETYQGLTVRQWAYRAVRNRREANQQRRNSVARGRTIRRLQNAARRQLTYPTGHWLDGAFLCIHRYERGADGWQTDTGNGYRGGLQMDWSFSSTYGPEWARREFGANPARWPASVQIAASIHAWTTRGFGPWPNTSRACGLR
jgi:hypothetical protein